VSDENVLSTIKERNLADYNMEESFIQAAGRHLDDIVY